MAFIKKVILTQNHIIREKYSNIHLYDPLFKFFYYIVYINEAYINPILQV